MTTTSQIIEEKCASFDKKFPVVFELLNLDDLVRMQKEGMTQTLWEIENETRSKRAFARQEEQKLFLIDALLEVEQAGYARAMGEAREAVRKCKSPTVETSKEPSKQLHEARTIYRIDAMDALSSLTPTDNNKEIKD